MVLKRLSALIATAGYLFSSTVALAAGKQVDSINLSDTQKGHGIIANTGLNTLLGNSLTVVFAVAAILVLAMLIWGGVEWVLSGGDKEKVGNARKRIISSLLGLVVIALAYVILKVVGGIFGFDVLSNFVIPSLDCNDPTACP